MWRRKEGYKYSQKQTFKASIKYVKHNSVVDENGIHHDGKQDEDVKEYTDGDEDDEEEFSDDGGTGGEYIF